MFPEIVGAIAALPRGPHILNGDGVVLDEHGHTSFSEPRRYSGAGSCCAFAFCENKRVEPVRVDEPPS